MNGIVATAQTDIDAPREDVWRALTDPAHVEQWMFGSRLETDWQVGSPITWSGEYEGTSYEDKGEVLAYDEPSSLSLTHFSPMSGQDDVPANYHRVAYTLTDTPGGGTHVELSQDGNGSEEEAEHARATWEQMLGALKDHVESPSGGA